MQKAIVDSGDSTFQHAKNGVILEDNLVTKNAFVNKQLTFEHIIADSEESLPCPDYCIGLSVAFGIIVIAAVVALLVYG